MNIVYLQLPEEYGNHIVAIDATTFQLYSNTTGYHWNDIESFMFTSFILADLNECESIIEQLKATITKNYPNKDEDLYVKLRTKFDSYVVDKRPRITLRITPGIKGIRNYAQIRFVTEEIYHHWYKHQQEQK